jgi:hypothetical protein
MAFPSVGGAAWQFFGFFLDDREAGRPWSEQVAATRALFGAVCAFLEDYPVSHGVTITETASIGQMGSSPHGQAQKWFDWGKHPIAAHSFDDYSSTMKANLKRKTLTFGEFIASVYEVCAKQKAKGIVQHAVNSHQLQFRGHQRFWIS